VDGVIKLKEVTRQAVKQIEKKIILKTLEVHRWNRQATARALVTYKDRMPAEVWYGRPDVGGQYCHTSVHFTKQTYQYTPAIEGNYWFGQHYQMFRMAHTFRKMVQRQQEPVPHPEILEVTAIIQAAAKSVKEKGRLVALAEVME